MDNHDGDSDIYPINNLEGLEKSCACKYNIHKLCILEWIKKKPICVMCNHPIYYIDNNTHDELLDITNNEELSDYETSKDSCNCIIIILCISTIVVAIYIWI